MGLALELATAPCPALGAAARSATGRPGEYADFLKESAGIDRDIAKKDKELQQMKRQAEKEARAAEKASARKKGGGHTWG